MEKWLEPKTITIWIIIIAALVLLLSVSVIAMAYLNFRRMLKTRAEEAELKIKHQKKLLETSVLTQEKERTRIAADLHDSIIGKLSGIRYKQQLSHDPRETDQLLGEAIAEARRISHDLSPPLIESKTIAELVEELVHPWKKKFKVRVISDVRSNVAITTQVKIQLVRILQELVTNATRHAGADSLFIHLRQSLCWLILKVNDNGHGFDQQKKPKGLGLYNIELRMQQLEGHYRIKSVHRKGVSALFVLPHTQFEHA